MKLINDRRLSGAFILFFILLAAQHAFAQQDAARQEERIVRVVILQVNDVYRFTPADRGLRGGLARVSTLRKQIMEKTPNTLFLLSGDTISPSVESLTYKGAQMIDAWNAVGLDYSVFGNHEFDFGPEVLRERM
ncbi:MAG TPA: metallophosphoesterase, partial [Pyrinomonadaceae bacterium]|nr:metallophosphoesterase [Pyrinomonadaceae bacterium]